jgi:hypothetical protein
MNDVGSWYYGFHGISFVHSTTMLVTAAMGGFSKKQSPSLLHLEPSFLSKCLPETHAKTTVR